MRSLSITMSCFREKQAPRSYTRWMLQSRLVVTASIGRSAFPGMLSKVLLEMCNIYSVSLMRASNPIRIAQPS